MPQPSPEQLLRAAMAHHQSGRLKEAEATFRQILSIAPGQPQVMLMLAMLLGQMKRPAEGVELARSALASAPKWAEGHNALANLLRDTGHYDEALASHARAIALKPALAQTWYDQAATQKAAGRLGDAVESYHRAIALKPDFHDAYYNLGNTLRSLGRPAEAVDAYRTVMAARPDDRRVLNNLGAALAENRQPGQAVEVLRRAVTLDPTSANTFMNLGGACRAAGALDDAMDALAKAVSLAPASAEAHFNLGLALNDCRRYDEAAACMERTIAIKPDFGHAYWQLANVHMETARPDDAITAYRRATELSADPQVHSSLCYAACFHPDYTPRQALAESLEWSRRFEPASPAPRTTPRATAGRRVRVGYVSPDFRNHATTFFTLPLLSNHDHERFELFCYSDVTRQDHLTERIRDHANHWRDLTGLSYEQAADRVRADDLDVLVDLTLHMGANRLPTFALRPAPVQVCWLAYAGSTGLASMDYRLTDPQIDPPGEHDDWYRERSVRLPETAWCYDPLIDLPAAGQPPVDAAGHVTFGCLNNFRKVNEPVIRLWSDVLRGVDQSRMILLAPEGSARERTRAIFANAGVGADRIEFLDFLPRDAYLRTYDRIDVCLDTLPYCGNTTTLDSLYMGVPVVSLLGHTAVGRAGLTLLGKVGLIDLVAKTPAEFVSVATVLATDRERLRELRMSLRPRLAASPLMDGPRFARAVESAYLSMLEGSPA